MRFLFLDYHKNFFLNSNWEHDSRILSFLLRPVFVKMETLKVESWLQEFLGNISMVAGIRYYLSGTGSWIHESGT